ncbi:hypothetical protein ASG35_12495 [Burkholderia sp. Leaf177]|nr:hypothetical protein ASG35_12495 [Burkholderia sp. Leaf177]
MIIGGQLKIWVVDALRAFQRMSGAHFESRNTFAGISTLLAGSHIGVIHYFLHLSGKRAHTLR